MSNPNNGLATVQPSDVVAPRMDAEKRELVRKTYGRGLTDLEFELMIADAEHNGLDVVAGDVAAIKFGNGPATFLKRIGGLRKLADRSGLLAGTEGPLWCGKDGRWVEVWLDESHPPAAAKFMVWRADRERPITAVVTWAERAQRQGNGQLMPNWKSMPAHMLGKVAEADAYRKARLVPDARYDPTDPRARQKALGRLHAIAADRGLTHEQARAVVAELVPGIESLTDEQVSIDDLHDAASMIDALGVQAVDPDTGEIIDDGAPDVEEQWRIRVRETIEANTREAWKAVFAEAGDECWRWAVLIELAPNNRYRSEITDKARIRGCYTQEFVDAARANADAIEIGKAARARAAAADDLAPGEPPLDVEYVEATMPGMPAADRYTS